MFQSEKCSFCHFLTLVKIIPLAPVGEVEGELSDSYFFHARSVSLKYLWIKLKLFFVYVYVYFVSPHFSASFFYMVPLTTSAILSAKEKPPGKAYVS
jgi:hypothetical protein